MKLVGTGIRLLPAIPSKFVYQCNAFQTLAWQLSNLSDVAIVDFAPPHLRYWFWYGPQSLRNDRHLFSKSSILFKKSADPV